MIPLQKGLTGDIQEKTKVPKEHPVGCLLKIDHVALVLPDARHLLVGTVPAEKPLDPPSHVLAENYHKEDKRSHIENQSLRPQVAFAAVSSNSKSFVMKNVGRNELLIC